MGFGGAFSFLLGAILSSDGFCEKPIILIIRKINKNSSFLDMLLNLAVKIGKSWETPA